MAAEMFQEGDRQITNLEALARMVWNDGLSQRMGSQRTREMIVERLEGKAVRGEKVNLPDTSLDDQLDRTEAELINALGSKVSEASET
jgi:hypothetical protein